MWVQVEGEEAKDAGTLFDSAVSRSEGKGLNETQCGKIARSAVMVHCSAVALERCPGFPVGLLLLFSSQILDHAPQQDLPTLKFNLTASCGNDGEDWQY
jgi:hypothetical protein